MLANKYFQVKELVSSNIYKQYGDDAIKFLDPRALAALENVREILNVPLTCNNWYEGGSRNYSGYREPGCGVGVKNSFHAKGMAFDLISNKLTAKEMREILDNNQDKLKEKFPGYISTYLQILMDKNFTFLKHNGRNNTSSSY